MPTIDVTIEKLIYGGEGLAHHEGSTVFVPFVLPGERAAVEPTEQKKKFIRAQLEKLLETSPERTHRDASTSEFAAGAITSTFRTKLSSNTRVKSCARRCGGSDGSSGQER